ncbi:putative bifunctional diguanylate cyclase/phosphodiesterase [Altericroceibacterium endophyticum]|uniref:EAL domain-containing protein n=1 Tax=Altericroceibacterium endophyticum TaxID=1808508 RepID=A0A6I4T7G9_9SPHN|nr:EAL domain-containing protein [Altericroceibacterium endophyticum]MXO66081.1 EAL domain-containing protein [Altericroceibacterium endophyticum]
MRLLTRLDSRDERVRHKLVESLYQQPTSLAMGAASGMAISAIAAQVTRSPIITGAAVVLWVVAIARVIMSFWVARWHMRQDARTLELLYEIGAFSFAFMSGLVGALTVLKQSGASIQLLTVSFALAYGVGIAARNAGRPLIAIGQLLLCILPMIITCLIVGSLTLLIFAMTLMFLIIAMASITLNVFNVLKEQITAAETSAKMADKMRDLARTDVVTGLANRAGLNHDLVEKLMNLPKDEKLALYWLDLDKFKEVNDTLGHPVGDRVLAEVAQRLKGQAPLEATVARFGGDEFIIACRIEDREQCEKLAGDILEDICRPFRIDGERIESGASVGVAVLPDDGADIDTLMQSADLALYHAKVNGRNQVCFFAASMTRELVRKKEIEAELRAALARDELSIFFQPIVDLETGRIRTFEALVRWFHPEKGELRPDEFIPVAEETGVIITLGNWITAQAARACAQWPEDVTVAVNLSPLQIRASGAALGILQALREANLSPSRLELEVTESLFLDDNQNTARFIKELSEQGVRFALDDFGTGYSSLGYINKFPFKKIKVDRSFVSGPNIGVKSDAIIRAVAEMGSTLEMDIVAEGLETIDQVRAVREAGCTLGQGYYFSRAVPDYLAAMLLAQERNEDDSDGFAQRLTG